MAEMTGVKEKSVSFLVMTVAWVWLASVCITTVSSVDCGNRFSIEMLPRDPVVTRYTNATLCCSVHNKNSNNVQDRANNEFRPKDNSRQNHNKKEDRDLDILVTHEDKVWFNCAKSKTENKVMYLEDRREYCTAVYFEARSPFESCGCGIETTDGETCEDSQIVTLEAAPGPLSSISCVSDGQTHITCDWPMPDITYGPMDNARASWKIEGLHGEEFTKDCSKPNVCVLRADDNVTFLAGSVYHVSFQSPSVDPGWLLVSLEEIRKLSAPSELKLTVSNASCCEISWRPQYKALTKIAVLFHGHPIEELEIADRGQWQFCAGRPNTLYELRVRAKSMLSKIWSDLSAVNCKTSPAAPGQSPALIRGFSLQPDTNMATVYFQPIPADSWNSDIGDSAYGLRYTSTSAKSSDWKNIRIAPTASKVSVSLPDNDVIYLELFAYNSIGRSNVSKMTIGSSTSRPPSVHRVAATWINDSVMVQWEQEKSLQIEAAHRAKEYYVFWCHYKESSYACRDALQMAVVSPEKKIRNFTLNVSLSQGEAKAIQYGVAVKDTISNLSSAITWTQCLQYMQDGKLMFTGNCHVKQDPMMTPADSLDVAMMVSFFVIAFFLCGIPAILCFFFKCFQRKKKLLNENTRFKEVLYQPTPKLIHNGISKDVFKAMDQADECAPMIPNNSLGSSTSNEIEDDSVVYPYGIGVDDVVPGSSKEKTALDTVDMLPSSELQKHEAGLKQIPQNDAKITDIKFHEAGYFAAMHSDGASSTSGFIGNNHEPYVRCVQESLNSTSTPSNNDSDTSSHEKNVNVTHSSDSVSSTTGNNHEEYVRCIQESENSTSVPRADDSDSSSQPLNSASSTNGFTGNNHEEYVRCVQESPNSSSVPSANNSDSSSRETNMNLAAKPLDDASFIGELNVNHHEEYVRCVQESQNSTSFQSTNDTGSKRPTVLEYVKCTGIHGIQNASSIRSTNDIDRSRSTDNIKYVKCVHETKHDLSVRRASVNDVDRNRSIDMEYAKHVHKQQNGLSNRRARSIDRISPNNNIEYTCMKWPQEPQNDSSIRSVRAIDGNKPSLNMNYVKCM